MLAAILYSKFMTIADESICFRCLTPRRQRSRFIASRRRKQVNIGAV